MQQNNNIYPFYGPEDISRYLSGSMNAQEMHDIEKAALKDPLLADAIDGFRKADPIVTDTHLNSIKASILGLTGEGAPVVSSSPRKSPTQWWRWAVAASSLTLIAASAWWITEKAGTGALPVADLRPLPAADTISTVRATESKVPAKESTTNKFAGQPPQDNTRDLAPTLKKAAPAATTKAEPAEANTLSPLQKIKSDNDNIASRNVTRKTATHKIIQANENMLFGNAGLDQDAAPIAKMAFPPAANRVAGTQPVAYIQGQVVNKEGRPLPYASVSIPGKNNTVTNSDGSFVLPAYDSSFGVSVGGLGYETATAKLHPGKENKIVLNEASGKIDEVVVVGYGKRREKSVADLRDIRTAQAIATSQNEVIYPEEGWTHFYEELGSSLGVNKTKKTQTLQIKFTVDDNGDPVDFEIVESPDAILAKKAIEFIKKAKWKNFKLDKNALVKIEVN